LFHLTLYEPAWFEVAHGMVWQSVMVLAATIFSLTWMGVFDGGQNSKNES
jgi:hypothetical protein